MIFGHFDTHYTRVYKNKANDFFFRNFKNVLKIYQNLRLALAMND